MKRNITINMQGRLYAIDEDAYELLKQYEDSLRSYFSRQDGGGEIVNDIEARIAELFDEVRATGKLAIDIDDVQRIITRMGNPQQMDDGNESGETAEGHDGGNATGEADGEAAGQDEEPSVFDRIKKIFVRKDRRLYRDPQDKKVLGVLSGLSHYYGGDVTWWRIIVLLAGVLFVAMQDDWAKITFYMVIVYFFLGMVVPQAVTPEDRLRMNGKDVNLHNLAEEVTAEGKAEKKAASPTGSAQRGCLSTFGEVLLVFVKIVMWFAFGCVAIVFVSMLTGLLLLLFAPSLSIFTDSGILFSWAEHPMVGTIGVLSFVAFIVLGIYGVSRSFLSRRGQPGMSMVGRIVFITLLIASLVGSMTCGTIILSDIKDQIHNFDTFSHNTWRNSHTHNGVFIEDDDWEYLKSGGWRVVSHDYCNDIYSSSGEYYNGNANKRYLNSFDSGGRQLYRVERTDSVEPGTYRLSAIVRADGTGAYIYAIADGKVYKAQIPAEGCTGGQIWQEAKTETDGVDGDSLHVGRQKLLSDIANANDGNGYGWSRITIDGIVVKKGKVKYGLTSVPDITGDQFAGTWFSACDFRLVK